MADHDTRETDRATLAALRTELAASYPAFSPRALVSIAASFGLERFPESFLVQGAIADRSKNGARAVLKRMLAGRDGVAPHPLFSPDFYLLANPDVASAGVSPWAHYQVLGRAEGRAPHPLMDAATLAGSMPGVARANLFDEYLNDRQHWFADAGPFVDVRNFVLRGTWSPGSHPLVQLSSQLTGPWVHRRLMLVDAGSGTTTQTRLVAAAYLLTGDGGRARLGTIRVWTRDAAPPDADPGPFTVVPGFFVGTGGRERERFGTLALSPDRTVLRTPAETISLETGATVRATALTVLAGPATFAHLRSIVEDAAGARAAIAPFSRSQEIALRQLRRDLGLPGLEVLEFGTQVHVHADSVRTELPEPPPVPPLFDPAEADPRDVAVVLSAGARRRVTGEPGLRGLIAAGAALCLVDDAGLNTWLPTIQSRRVVLVEPTLALDVAAFVVDDCLRLLPHGTWGTR